MILLGVVLALMVAASVHDLMSRTVPDGYAVVIAGLGLTAALLGVSQASPLGALFGGLAGAFAGVLLFLFLGFGGADAKLLAALGLCVGIDGIGPLLFWTAVAGMMLSIAAMLRSKRELAYLPAITAGLAVFMAWPNALASLAGVGNG